MQTLIQRAFELVPECSNMRDLRLRLSSEGYDRLDAYLGGLGIQRQLRSRFNQNRGSYLAVRSQPFRCLQSKLSFGARVCLPLPPSPTIL